MRRTIVATILGCWLLGSVAVPARAEDGPIAAGEKHTCALTAAGGVKCWGSNFAAQLGDGTTTDRLTAVAVTGLGSGVQAVAAGKYHTCALTTAGAVKCWGNNGTGQMGDGTTVQRSTPVAVTGLGSGVKAIAAGAYHTCAVTTAGAVQCWGLGGTLGDGTSVQRLTPVAVIGLGSGVQAIAAGDSHSCSLTAAGGVQCWGSNGNGQLGDGTIAERLAPVAVIGLGSGVQAIAAGESHACAVTTAGAAKCWGSNGNGRLGDGTSTDRWTPVAVSGLGSGVQAIAAGLGHTCALTTAGAVRCWGFNGEGQLGDGTTTERLTSVATTGLGSGVQAITAGLNHACALTAAGVLLCWGRNSSGQLGDGTTTNRLTPVAVGTYIQLGSQLSIADLSIIEGDSGTTTATFMVSLSAALSGAVTFDIATDNGTAAAGSDYVARSLSSQTIPAGQTSYAFAVTVNGDVEVEGNETFTVNLGNVVGATVGDGQALGTIVNNDQSLLSIADVSVPEGNTATSTATFVVSLSRSMPTSVTFDVTTSNGSAIAGSDYSALGQVSRRIDAGRTSARFEVAITGDLAIEADESFNVTVSNVVGATLADVSAVGTIVNDDFAPIQPVTTDRAGTTSDVTAGAPAKIRTIAQIQGSQSVSPMVGKMVRTGGVVTALLEGGFVIQSASGEADSDPATSEGLFISSVGRVPALGDKVSVEGRVQEIQVGESSEQLTLTRLLARGVDVSAHTVAMPAPVALNTGNAGVVQLIGGLERYEGMRVAISKLRVVAPVGGSIEALTGRVVSNGMFYGVVQGVPRPFREPGMGTTERALGLPAPRSLRSDGNPERLLINSTGQLGAGSLSADVGDSLFGLTGVLGYGKGAYQVLPDPAAPITMVSGALPKAVSALGRAQVGIASVSMRRGYHEPTLGNQPNATVSASIIGLAKSANMICAYARNPAIIGVTGARDVVELDALAAATNSNAGNELFAGSCQGDAQYRVFSGSGRSKGGRLGFLASAESVGRGMPRVEVLSVREHDENALLRNPDGSREWLHEYPPIVLRARINGASGKRMALSVISTQFSALEGNLAAPGPHGWTTQRDYLRARRSSQALSLARLVQAIQVTNPLEKLVLLGDFDASEFSDGNDDLMGVVTGREAGGISLLRHLAGPVRPPLTNLTTQLAKDERYTDTRDGDAVALRHILVNQALLSADPSLHVETARINADFGIDNALDATVPMRAADSDPQVLYLQVD